MKGDRERCLAAGMDAYASKPIRAAEIFEVIAPLLFSDALGAKGMPGPEGPPAAVEVVGATPWLAPISLGIGALALGLCAYLAAVYLPAGTGGRGRAGVVAAMGLGLYSLRRS